MMEAMFGYHPIKGWVDRPTGDLSDFTYLRYADNSVFIKGEFTNIGPSPLVSAYKLLVKGQAARDFIEDFLPSQCH